MLDPTVEAAQRGDDWAGPALVTLLLPTLMGYVKEIGRDLSTADQEQAIERAVLRSVDRIDQYDPSRAQFSTWVRGALRYAVLDILREKGGTADELVAELPHWLEAPPGESSDGAPSEALTWSLLKLSVPDQIIISLRDFENLSYSEIAKRLGGGVTEGACRVRHHRALARLKTHLGSHPDYAAFAGASIDD